MPTKKANKSAKRPIRKTAKTTTKKSRKKTSSKKTSGKKTGKKTSKKTGKKTSKKTGKKTGKKTSKKTGKKTGKKTSKKTGKKTSKKTSKKTGKKSGKKTSIRAKSRSARKTVEQPPGHDPHARREAQKYENPIPSREFILQHLDHQGVPLSVNELAKVLDVHGPRAVEALRRRLKAMAREGQVMRNRRGGYGLASHMDLVCGRVSAHAQGFGFLIPESGGKDLYLSAREMRAVLHGDRVMARVMGEDRRGRKEGTIVEVLERATEQVVGRFYYEAGVGFVVPDNKRIHHDVLIPVEQRADAQHGQIVVARIVEQPTAYRQPIGRITEIVGEHMAPGMEIDVAIRSFGLRQDWSPQVEEEIKKFGEGVPEQAKQGREDIRDLPLVTIDGEDARDFDDAVYCEKSGNSWRLLVAIADVSAYVDPGSALDVEAEERGNSVYFPERVIPMLPEVLSNGLCSLNPEVDRLCMVCEMHISAAGRLNEHRFFPAVMRSHARLTYTKVAAMLVDGDKSLRREYEAVLPHLENLHALYRVLHASREKRGAIDFDSQETRIVFGKDRKIESIIPVVRNDAHRLIEECMLMANVSAATFLHQHKMPTLYRNHAGPTAEKITNVREFLGELGLQLGGGDEPRPTDYATLLDSIKDRPDVHLIQTVLLRSLSQAVYHPDNIGHFGLAFDAYAHFTSPIRRYPDLLVHRAIRHVLAGGSADDFVYSTEEIRGFGDHCSMTERRADEATWDTINWLKCEYMLDKVGETYAGTIGGVTSFGVFVELDNIYVEGLVHVTSLDNDYYHFDAAHHRLMGERTRKIYRLGDRIQVQVARVDLDERRIDFELA